MSVTVTVTVGERSIQVGREVFVCFVDYEKAFDRVNWVKLMEILKRIGVDWRDRKLIANLYMKQTAVVRIGGEDSEPGSIGRGVRQGCPLSPLLFNIYIEELVREAMQETDAGVKVGGENVKAVRFADDQAMVASSEEELQQLMNILHGKSKEYSMRINLKKTKVMRINREGKGAPLTINIEDIQLEEVNEFCYLGSIISRDGRCNKEVIRRIGMTKEAFTKRRELMSGSLSLMLKKRLIKSLVWSVLLYGSEAWTLNKDERRRLEACEMWIWRRMLKVSWKEHTSNEEILQQVQEGRILMETLHTRQKEWIGHILRHDSLLRLVLEGKIEGKKARGRPRTMLLDHLMGKKNNQRYEQLKASAQCREEWRHWTTEPALGQST